MSFWERIFHAILFEVGAICVAVLAVVLFGIGDSHEALGVSVIMAIIAMAWNMIFNWGFDKIFHGAREKRTAKLRVFHTVTFETGLLIFTVPVIAYMLNLTLWQAFLTDIGLTLLIMIYAFCFNWSYDHLRAKIIAWRAKSV